MGRFRVNRKKQSRTRQWNAIHSYIIELIAWFKHKSNGLMMRATIVQIGVKQMLNVSKNNDKWNNICGNYKTQFQKRHKTKLYKLFVALLYYLASGSLHNLDQIPWMKICRYSSNLRLYRSISIFVYCSTWLGHE